MVAEINQNHKDVLDDLVLSIPGVRSGKMFGYPAYFVGKKLSVCIVENGVGVKVPEDTALKLISQDPNITYFQPLGRKKMREWIQINVEDSEDLRVYKDLFIESFEFVLRNQLDGA
jgi:hypothetical protein